MFGLPNLYVAIGLVVAFVSVGVYGYHHGVVHQQLLDNAVVLEKVNAAVANERKKQEKVDAISQKQVADLSAVNDKLQHDLIQLRKRAARPAPGMPQSTQVVKQDCTGSQLFREDAEFLRGESASADQCGIALEQCYKYADEVGQ